MSSMLIDEKHIPFENDHTKGIVAYIQEGSNTLDIFGAGIASIFAPSKSERSKDPSVIFGINQGGNNYYSTILTTKEPRYILIDFKKYSISLEGISLFTGGVDWFEKYNIEGSNDMISIISKTEISCTKFPNLQWQHFQIPKTKPYRYINISVDRNALTNKKNSNFAIYRMEFFGSLLHTKKVICILSTCNNFALLCIMNTLFIEILISQ